METIIFKEFKEAVIEKCKEQSACVPEFRKLLAAKNYKELIKVLTANFNWSSNYRIFTLDAFKIVDKKYLNNNDLHINTSTSAGYLFVDSATVRASGSATVEAWGSATVRASGSAYVCSYSTLEHKLSEKAICRYYLKNKIVVSKDSKIDTY